MSFWVTLYLFMMLPDYICCYMLINKFDDLTVTPRSSRYPTVCIGALMYWDNIAIVCDTIDQADNVFYLIERNPPQLCLRIKIMKTEILPQDQHHEDGGLASGSTSWRQRSCLRIWIMKTGILPQDQDHEDGDLASGSRLWRWRSCLRIKIMKMEILPHDQDHEDGDLACCTWLLAKTNPNIKRLFSRSLQLIFSSWFLHYSAQMHASG